ncbi:cyclic nucleotide-binding domain-containing protein [Geodermatophilus sabuli]|uniref:histidine kinase n=1 Tax=Geodermatophilus sabuli TaxID=1564158 RepID=A0A7K3VUY2_9ACTN|nr:ATP-binding protein [Geodermatophilus sabuli]NEK56451.1 cyclic nucleotide-binding domain-containing protein [Geodermatophilus sabuli]
MTDVGELRPLVLFDGTGDDQLGELCSLGTELTFAPGDELFREGRPADSWWVLLEGRIDLVRHLGHEETVLGAMDVPGRWAGGFRAWDEHGVYLATGRAATRGRAFRVAAPALRAWSTSWFPFGVHVIEGLVRTARNFESVARQKEALASLGTLAAGLAHELNNPAAAAARSADALGTECEVLFSSVGELVTAAISPDGFTALDGLRRELEPAPAGDPMAVADREDALAAWLADHDVPRDWLLAPALAAGGADPAWCDRVAAALGRDALDPAFAWVASTLSATALLAEVRESTRRVSELVAAVKSYSQLDRASMQRTDVVEGLESTLVMLAARIPPGVRVVRDHGPDVPPIQAAAGELNQVWTNLVDNALDAMAGQGTLRVCSRRDGRGVLVEIGDTGPGMSPETREHAFDPFFTTKGVGEGTGLGLDMARRIVARHRGEISIDLRPGETVLRVRLP